MTTNKKWLMAAVLVLVVILSACGNQTESSSSNSSNNGNESSVKELTFKDKLGEATVKINPKNVVVFDFGSLDTLRKLGVDVAGVPVSNLPSYLDQYKDRKYADVGTLFEPNFEKINELSPELIIIGGRQSDAYEELSKIAPTIYMAVDTEHYMESFQENVNKLAQIFGKEEEAKQALAVIDSSVTDLHDKAAASQAKGLIVLANEGSLSAYGTKSRFGIIHDVFGVTPVDSHIEVSTHGQKVSFEYVAQKNPDYLFVIDRGAVVKEEGKEQVTAKQAVENDLVKNTNAFKNNHIVYLDPNYWYLSGGGLISVSEMIKEVSAAFN
ncbi:siderophore ABC transporter substrate-binding protein [Paenibacillus sp. JX-17]|uniref:Siderophore ABC transporter substrate-binding protein n=1 Tax=Paenibacillus lacisoli TaxID=3064525 RepID=A0ABT9CH34_9BACL|nr:siderophore ABC transporter substrate-binding protein [Paenibacillus sp. JX-17]MDO7907898.1 siderophore ABC transporter substrate-binding protein [Paenibacillus sp. JX-17]